VRRVNSISVADEQSADHGFADGLLAVAPGENTENGVQRSVSKYYQTESGRERHLINGLGTPREFKL